MQARHGCYSLFLGDYYYPPTHQQTHRLTLEERLSPRNAGMGTANDPRLDDDSSSFFLLDDRPSPVLLLNRRVLLVVVESPLIMLVAVPAVITF